MQQLEFDTDIIEISNGNFFKLSSRQFLNRCPYTEDQLGKISPRIFKPFDRMSKIDGGYFESCVKNSFPELEQRTHFLNKFYQCLLCNQLPIKTRKVCMVGPSDSGKSSLAAVLFGLTHPEKVSAISKEKTFGLSMINEDTQLIFIDELSGETLSADQAKVFLQGGMLTVAKKHANARIVENFAGIYITCNTFPEYGIEQKNIERRLDIFHTNSLTDKCPEAVCWLKDNAFMVLM